MPVVLSISLENKPGALAEVCEALSGAKLNIEAVEAEAQGDFATARLLVDDATAATRLLRSKGLDVVTAEVIELHLDNRPGELARVARQLADSKINIVSIFGATPTTGGQGRILLRVADAAAAKKVLGIKARPAT